MVLMSFTLVTLILTQDHFSHSELKFYCIIWRTIYYLENFSRATFFFHRQFLQSFIFSGRVFENSVVLFSLIISLAHEAVFIQPVYVLLFSFSFPSYFSFTFTAVYFFNQGENCLYLISNMYFINFSVKADHFTWISSVSPSLIPAVICVIRYIFFDLIQ